MSAVLTGTALIKKALRETSNGLSLQVRLRPGASANRIEGLRILDDGQAVLQVRVTAVAEKGKANRALIALLAKAWKLPKSDISIIAGMTNRQKTLALAGPPADLRVRLLAALGPES